MTTFATLPVPMRRLFERIDAHAEGASLKIALQSWQHKRRGRLYPAARDLARGDLGDVADHLFAFAAGEDGRRSWRLVSAGAQAERILRPRGRACPLDRLANHRIGALLRRLFAFAADGGEPVAVTFVVRQAGRRRAFEALAAPTASDGHRIDGMFGGITASGTARA